MYDILNARLKVKRKKERKIILCQNHLHRFVSFNLIEGYELFNERAIDD